MRAKDPPESADAVNDTLDAEGPSLSASVGAEASSSVTTGFRRSRRVSFEMPADVYVCRENQEPIFENGKTLCVSAHGALLALTTPVFSGETLRIVNPRTRQEIECRIRRF